MKSDERMEEEEGHGPSRRRDSRNPRKNTPYDRPAASGRPASVSTSCGVGGAAAQGNSNHTQSLISRSLAWAASPLVTLAQKFPGVGSKAVGETDAVDEEEGGLDGAQAPATSGTADLSNQRSGNSVGADSPQVHAEAAADAAPQTSTAMVEGSPVAEPQVGQTCEWTPGPLQQRMPLHTGAKKLGMDSLMLNSPSIRAQSGDTSRRRNTISGHANASPGIPSFRLPQSPAVSERQHRTELELPAAQPSTSQPAAPVASAAAARPLSGAARPSPFLGQSGPTITGLWGVKSSPAGSVSSLSRQASAERRSSGLFAQPGQSAGVPFAAKAQPAHQSRFGQQGAVRTEAQVQFGTLPARRFNGSAAGVSARKPDAPSRAHLVRTPAAAQPLSQGIRQPVPATQAMSSALWRSSSATEAPAPAAAAAADGVEGPSSQQDLMMPWTPMRSMAGLQPRALGLKRDRDPSPGGTPQMLRRTRQRPEPLGSAERRQWQAGSTPYHIAKRGSGRGRPGSSDHPPRSPMQISPAGREVTDSARRILKALEQASKPSAPTAAQLAAQLPPPPPPSDCLDLPPPLVLPLPGPSAQFGFSSGTTAPAPSRGFLAGTPLPKKVAFKADAEEDLLAGAKAGPSFKAAAEGPLAQNPSLWSTVQTPAASTSGLPPFKLGQFSSAQEPAFPALRAHDPAVPPVSMSPWAPKASTAAAGAGPSSIAPMGFSSKAESASKVSAALAPASIAPPLGFFTGALGKQSSAETPSYTFGRQRSSEQAVLMEQLAQIVRSASPASVPPPTFSFGRGKQERQTEAGLPAGSTVQPTSTLGVIKGAAKVSPGEEMRRNSEAEQAAAVKLPTESDTDDDAATAAGHPPQLQQNGFLQPNAGGKPETKADQGKEEEEGKPVAAATGGWDASFLAKNKATLLGATAAMEQEIEKKAKGTPSPSPSPSPTPPASGFQFGVPPAAAAAPQQGLSQGFSFGVPAASTPPAAATPQQSQPSGLLDFLNSSVKVPEKPLFGEALTAAEPQKLGVPDKAAGKENDHSAPKLVEAVPVKSEPVPFSLGAAQPSGEGSKPAPFAFGVPPGKTEERAPDEKLGLEAQKPKAANALGFGSQIEVPSSAGQQPPLPTPALQIHTKPEASTESERAMSISPMSAGAARGTEFNDASTAQSAPSASSSPAFSWVNPTATQTSFTFGAANPASNPGNMPSAGTGGFPGIQQSAPAPAFGAQPTAVGGGPAAAPNPAPFTGFGFNATASALAFGGGQAQPFGNAASTPAFANQTQPAVSGFSGFGQQPGSAAASAPSTFGGGSAPAANGSFQFGNFAGSAPSHSAPGFGGSFGAPGGFGSVAPPGGQIGAAPGFGGGGPITFGAAPQAQSMPAIGAFAQPNGAPPANGPFGGSMFGQQQPGAAPVFGSQGQFNFGNAGGQPGGAGMTLGTASDSGAQGVPARRKHLTAKRVGRAKK